MYLIEFNSKFILTFKVGLVGLILYSIYKNFGSYSRYNGMTGNRWRYQNIDRTSTTPYDFNNEIKSGMDVPDVDPLVGIVIDGRFLIGAVIGEEGYTGVVRRCIDLQSFQEVAIKFAEEKRWESLDKEYQNYVKLGATDPNCLERGIPYVIYYGVYEGYRILVLSILGPTIREMRNKHEDSLTLKTLSLIGLQLVDILEYIHSKGLIYHDMKPDNICIGSTNETANKIYLIDFAFSEPVYDDNGKPKKRDEVDQFDGTPEYMAKGPLNGLRQMRKDDFISMGIVMLELNGADIPWMELDLEDETIWDSMVIILKYWDEHGLESMYGSTENAEFFRTYFEYLDSVRSSAAPDYNRLRDILRTNLIEDDVRRGDLAFMERFDPSKLSKESNEMKKRN